MTEITFPTAEALVASRLAQRLAEPAPERDVQQDIKPTISLMRQRATEDADQLAAFAETIALHFGCEALASPARRVQLKSTFDDLRRAARVLSAEADRQAADPGAPPRGARGRVTSAQ